MSNLETIQTVNVVTAVVGGLAFDFVRRTARRDESAFALPDAVNRAIAKAVAARGGWIALEADAEEPSIYLLLKEWSERLSDDYYGELLEIEQSRFRLSLPIHAAISETKETRVQGSRLVAGQSLSHWAAGAVATMALAIGMTWVSTRPAELSLPPVVDLTAQEARPTEDLMLVAPIRAYHGFNDETLFGEIHRSVENTLAQARGVHIINVVHSMEAPELLDTLANYPSVHMIEPVVWYGDRGDLNLKLRVTDMDSGRVLAEQRYSKSSEEVQINPMDEHELSDWVDVALRDALQGEVQFTCHTVSKPVPDIPVG